jgi:alpha-glucuronidase
LTTPENLLLWFHRLPWDYRLASGGTLWDGLVRHYRRGVEAASRMVATWESLRGKVDAERHRAVLAKLRVQAADAAAWRDKCLRYFQQFSGRPLMEVEASASTDASTLKGRPPSRTR